MKAVRTLAALALLSLSGCYHYTVVTGAPAADKTVGRNWQKSFIIGLVPPDTINTRADCPSGVAKCAPFEPNGRTTMVSIPT